MVMTTTPHLEVPQRSAPAPASRSGGAAMVTMLLIVVIGLQVWSLLRPSRPAEAARATPTAGTSTDERSLAMKLEDRNLPDAAVDAWGRYLATASVGAKEEAAIRYRVGKLLQEAKRYQEAVESYFRAEQLLGEDGGDLRRQITVRVRECLVKLGQYADLSREMAARADLSDEDASMQGRQVVAQIGEDKIHVSDFDRMLTAQVEQLIAMQGGLSEEEADRIRRRMHGQFADPQAKAEQLQQFVASRVLAGEARDRGLEEDSAFRQQLVDFADRLLAARLLGEEVGKRATVTPQDVERFYAANKDRYADPATVSIAHVLCSTEEEAREVIQRAQAGEDFAALAREQSLDEATKADGGVLAGKVTDRDGYVPGMGGQAEAHAAILAAGTGSVLATPYKSDKGWHVVKVLERAERRQKPFEEVRERVEQDARSARREEVTQQYLHELFDQRGVRFYPQAFAATDAQKAATGEK